MRTECVGNFSVTEMELPASLLLVLLFFCYRNGGEEWGEEKGGSPILCGDLTLMRSWEPLIPSPVCCEITRKGLRIRVIESKLVRVVWENSFFI